MVHRYLKIYKRRVHILWTFLIVLLPFVFVLFVGSLTTQEKLSFIGDLFSSTVRLVIAYAVSVVLATILGITLSRGRLGTVTLPLFDVLQSFPTFAMLPLAVHLFGPSETTVIIFLIITVIWPMLFAIISSQKLIKSGWEEAAQVYGATGWKRIVYFALPIAAPGIVTGSIVGLGEGWEAVVGAEIIVGLRDHGLGGFFNGSSESGHLVFFGVMALLLFIFALNHMIWLPLLEKSHKMLTE
jgi:NitT/TauT family transport system permease protein